MSEAAISVRGLSKCYRLGTIGRHTLADECRYAWCKLRGRDPFREMLGVGDKRRGLSEEDRKGLFWALREATFDVEPGAVVGVIGRNGAGKSTLLKLLTRITEPTSGEAVIQGRVASLLEVGTGFHPELTGRENVYMNGTILGMKRREIASKFDEIVAFSEIEKFIETPVKRYSSGMYVRLAFAVAAHLEPEILLVDEVLAVGDAAFQKKCLGKMGEVARAGRTVLFVSHNMGAVKSLCTSGLCVEGGRVSEMMPVEDAVERYLSGVAEQSSQTPLPERTDRRGSGRVKMTGLDMVFDPARKQWVVHVEYRSDLPAWKFAVVRVMLKRSGGDVLTRLDSSLIRGLPEDFPPCGKITIELGPDLLLSPGEYLMDAWCQSGKEMLDAVSDAFAFSVPDFVPFDWKRTPDSKAPCLWNQHWTMEKG